MKVDGRWPSKRFVEPNLSSNSFTRFASKISSVNGVGKMKATQRYPVTLSTLQWLPMKILVILADKKRDGSAYKDLGQPRP